MATSTQLNVAIDTSKTCEFDRDYTDTKTCEFRLWVYNDQIRFLRNFRQFMATNPIEFTTLITMNDRNSPIPAPVIVTASIQASLDQQVVNRQRLVPLYQASVDYLTELIGKLEQRQPRAEFNDFKAVKHFLGAQGQKLRNRGKANCGIELNGEFYPLRNRPDGSFVLMHGACVAAFHDHIINVLKNMVEFYRVGLRTCRDIIRGIETGNHEIIDRVWNLEWSSLRPRNSLVFNCGNRYYCNIFSSAYDLAVLAELRSTEPNKAVNGSNVVEVGQNLDITTVDAETSSVKSKKRDKPPKLTHVKPGLYRPARCVRIVFDRDGRVDYAFEAQVRKSFQGYRPWGIIPDLYDELVAYGAYEREVRMEEII